MAGEWYSSGYNYSFGYCQCERCSCCGKVVPQRFVPYVNPYVYIVPTPYWITPIPNVVEQPYTVTVTTTTPKWTIGPDGKSIQLTEE